MKIYLFIYLLGERSLKSLNLFYRKSTFHSNLIIDQSVLQKLNLSFETADILNYYVLALENTFIKIILIQ